MNGAILIVDSDAAMAQRLHDQLADLGHAIEVALHGGDALMLASLSRPDVVVLDIDLCDRSGLEVMRELHEFDKSIEVVLLGGSHDDAAGRAALKAGAFDYLHKPVGVDALSRAVAIAVAASQGSRPGVVVPFRSEPRVTPATPAEAEEQACAACKQLVPDLTRAVAYKRALFHPECWRERRRRRADTSR